VTSRLPVQCRACVRWRPNSGSCEAYPLGIPIAIQLLGADHRQPMEGDHGIRFEQAPGPQAAEDFANWDSFFGQQ
jgi:hypothetical protein